jgi:hypothetical protein
MTDAFMPALRPDLYGQLAATDAYQCRARRLFERGQVAAVEGNQADVRVGYDARGNALELKQVPIISGYVPSVGDWVSIQYEAGHSGAPWITGPSMAADETSDAAGIGVFPVRESEPADPQRSAIYFDESLETWRGWDGADWVDFSGKLHNSLPDLQGGMPGEYYHLTEDEYAAIGGGAFPATAVIYADANGKLAGDATKFKWTGGQLQVLAGSAAAPALSRLGYTDDGIFWPGDGMLGLVTSGAERVRIDNTGLLLGCPGLQLPSYHLVYAGDRPVHVWLDQTLAGGGNVQDLYHSVHSGGKNFRWGRSQGVYDRASFIEILRLYVSADTDSQLLMASGAAATPGYGFLGNPDCGWYYADTYIGAVLDGTERFRWSGNNVGMVATGRLYGDGVSCSGDTYIRERAANIWCFTAGGNDQFEVRSDHGYLRPTAYEPLSDGEFSSETDDNAWKHRIGSVIHRNGWCIYSGSPVEDTTVSASDRTLDSFAIPAAYWKVGKRITVVAPVLLEREGNGKSVTAKLYIGSTLVMSKTMGTGPAPSWQSGHFEFEMSFVVGAIAGSGITLYPTRNLRSYTSGSHASFNTIQSVASDEFWPMEPDTPGIAIATNAAQAIAVKYACNDALATVHVRLQGLTIYST